MFLPQPQNILLTSLSPLGDIKIVDFGLARRLGAVGELREILGTPEYVGEYQTRLPAENQLGRLMSNPRKPHSPM